MADAQLVWDSGSEAGDLLLAGTQLATGEDLETSLVLSLFLERGTWWADPELGSRLHELKGRKVTDQLLADAEAYVREALAHFITDRVAESVEVTVERTGLNSIGILGALVRGAERLPFDFAWSADRAA